MRKKLSDLPENTGANQETVVPAENRNMIFLGGEMAVALGDDEVVLPGNDSYLDSAWLWQIAYQTIRTIGDLAKRFTKRQDGR